MPDGIFLTILLSIILRRGSLQDGCFLPFKGGLTEIDTEINVPLTIVSYNEIVNFESDDVC